MPDEEIDWYGRGRDARNDGQPFSSGNEVPMENRSQWRLGWIDMDADLESEESEE